MPSIASHCARNIFVVSWVGPLLFSRDEISRIPVRIPGVYLLHAFNRYLGYYPPIYVGQTSDLTNRLIQHMESQTTSPEIRYVRKTFRMYFTAAPVLSREMREAIEAGLIGALRPMCNRQVPRIRPIYCNLPDLKLNLREEIQNETICD
jgi:hypothetical protein